MSVIVKGGGGKPEEEKAVTAGTSVIEVSPSSGKLMKKVTVNPTPTESKSVTPTTSELTVTPSEGKHLSKVIVGAVEDVTPEVTAQTPVITQILECLVGKAQGANITPETVLKGFKGYRGQELVEGEYVPHGAYVWKKLTTEGGDFVDFVTADVETAYPDGGEQGGYWYEKVGEIDPTLFGCTKIAIDKVVFSNRTQISDNFVYHSLGEIPKIAFLFAPSTFNGREQYDLYFCVFWKTPFNDYCCVAPMVYSSGFFVNSGQDNYTYFLTKTSVKTYGRNVYCAAGVEYTLITMA